MDNMKIVANVIIIKDDKVLMVQENWGHVKGMWNFPAGHVDDGENLFDAAVREAKEETGLNVKLTHYVMAQNAVYDDRQVIHFNFLAEVIDGEISFDKNEISRAEFLKVREVLTLPEDKLRCKELRVEVLNNVLNNRIYPLSIISNYDYKA